MNKEKIIYAMKVMDAAQQEVWLLHHKVKQYDEPLAMKIWEQTLQLEHGLLVLNEEILDKPSYFDGSDNE